MNQEPKLNRRQFVRGATAAGIAGAAAFTTGSFAPAVHGDDKSGRSPIIAGDGEHRYEVQHDWLQSPKGVALGDTHGLCQDAAGRIYLAHTVHGSSTRKDAVLVYDENGRFQNGWGADFQGGAHGLDIRSEAGTEYIYHCDTRRRLVVKTTLAGEEVWTIGYPKDSGVYPAANKFCPTNVAFAPDGSFFLGDGYGSSYIHRHDAAGKYLKTIAGPGSEAGQVRCPHGLWVDSRSGEAKLAVADRSNRRIQYLSLEGKHLGFVTEGMRQPCHFKIRGDVMLVPDLSSVITLLDKDNKVITHIGDGHPSKLRGAPRDQFLPGKFVHPHDAIFLKNGDILVAEWVPIGRVTRLRKVG